VVAAIRYSNDQVAKVASMAHLVRLKHDVHAPGNVVATLHGLERDRHRDAKLLNVV